MPVFRPTAVDLFAGAGGLSLGLEQAGFDVLASNEYDPVHATTHEHNFPLTELLCASAADITGAQLRDAARRGWERHHPGVDWDGHVNVVAGGPPCQGFSWIGKRQVDDTRNDLVFHFFRLVNELRPDYFVMENVPGMQSGAHKALLTDLIGKFEDAGYHVEPARILNAANYGVPQDRRRLFLIGSREGLPVATHPEHTVEPVRKVRSTVPPPMFEMLPLGPSVTDAVADLPDLDGFDSLADSDQTALPPEVRAAQEEAASPYARRLMGLDADETDYAHTRAWDPNLLTSSMRTMHTPTSVARFAATAPGDVEPVSRFLRLPGDGLCNTLRAGTGGERGAFTSPRPIHPTLARVLSVREAARLHSFPDWFRFHVTKWNGFRQIGNAVPPLLGRAVGAEIIRALGITPERPTGVLETGPDRLLSLTMKEAAAHTGADTDSIPKSRRVSRTELAILAAQADAETAERDATATRKGRTVRDERESA